MTAGEMARLRLPASVIDSLVWGDAASIQTLRSAQLSRRLLMLRALLDEASGRARADARTARLFDAYDVLAETQRRAPEATAQVLTYPFVGDWLERCLRRLRHGGAGSDPSPLWYDLARLHGVAVAAALRSGYDFNAALLSQAGEVWLPGIGRANLAVGDGDWVTITSDGKGARLSAGFQEIQLPEETPHPGWPTPGWQPLRLLASDHGGRRLELWLDDVDPARGCFGIPAEDRLPATAVRRWSALLDGAWARLVGDHERHAAVLRAGLTTLTPLVRSERHTGVSVSARAAFGAAALTEPTDSLALCVSLIHEVRHTMLYGLLHVIALYDGTDEGRYYSPWRSDPRPLEGLLHGAYAFLGVADFWRRQWGVAQGEDRARAEFEFLRTREQVRQVLGVLSSSGRLTPAGDQLVSGLSAAVDAWSSGSAAETSTLTYVERALALHHFSWRVRNTAVDPEGIERLTEAWLDGRPCPPVGPTVVVAGTEVTFTDAAGWDRLRAEEATDLTRGADTTRAAAALAAGHYEFAAQSFRCALTTDPGSHLDWAGLLHSLAHLPDNPATRAMRARPELVAAVCRAALSRSGQGPDPLLVADWLAAGGD